MDDLILTGVFALAGLYLAAVLSAAAIFMFVRFLLFSFLDQDILTVLLGIIALIILLSAYAGTGYRLHRIGKI